MAIKTYYNKTGMLVLDQITPVISALFGDFNLQKHDPVTRQMQFSAVAELDEVTWDRILLNVQGLATQLGLVSPDFSEETMADFLCLLASHFGRDGDTELGNLIEHYEFNGDADLGVLFELAWRFNDGHGLSELHLEAGIHGDNPRLFIFGGEGQFRGLHFNLHGSSKDPRVIGARVEEALAAGDAAAAAQQLMGPVNLLLCGIRDADVRAAVKAQLLSGLQASNEESGAPTVTCVSLPEPIGEVRDGGVEWFGPQPHVHPVGTRIIAIPPEAGTGRRSPGTEKANTNVRLRADGHSVTAVSRAGVPLPTLDRDMIVAYRKVGLPLWVPPSDAESYLLGHNWSKAIALELCGWFARVWSMAFAAGFRGVKPVRFAQEAVVATLSKMGYTALRAEELAAILLDALPSLYEKGQSRRAIA